MNNFRFALLFALITSFTVACKNQEQAQSSGVVFPATPAGKTQPGERTTTAASEEAEPRTWVGREIVLETSNRLTTRLKAEGETASRIKSEVKKAFDQSGGKMEMTYSDAQAREKAKEIIRMAADPIRPMLNAEQRQTLQNMMEK